MTDAEDAAMHAVQPAGADAVSDRAALEPRVDQLAPADDAVLACGDGGDDRIAGCRVDVFTHHVNKGRPG